MNSESNSGNENSTKVFCDLGFSSTESKLLSENMLLRIALEEIFVLASESRSGKHVDAREYYNIASAALKKYWTCGTVHPGRECPNDAH